MADLTGRSSCGSHPHLGPGWDCKQNQETQHVLHICLAENKPPVRASASTLGALRVDRQYYPFTFTSLFQIWSRNCGALWGTQSSSAEHKVNFFHLSLWHWGPPLPDMWPFQENKNRVEVFTVDIAVDWADLQLCHQVFALCEHIGVVQPEPLSTTNATDITSRTPATITAL